jgi:hypothetical protein
VGSIPIARSTSLDPVLNFSDYRLPPALACAIHYLDCDGR